MHVDKKQGKLVLWGYMAMPEVKIDSSQKINLAGGLGHEAHYFGRDAFSTLSGALSSRTKAHPEFLDTLQKFVDYAHSDKTDIVHELHINGHRKAKQLSEQLLGKWVGLAAEQAILDGKPMPNEADGARRGQLEGEVQRLEDVILLSHKGDKSVTLDENIVRIIADPKGDTVERLIDGLDGVTDTLVAVPGRAAVKLAPLAVAGTMLFSSCLGGGGIIPSAETVMPPAITAQALESQILNVGKQISIVTGDISIPSAISGPDCTPGASTQPLIIELTGPATEQPLPLAICSADIKIGETEGQGALFVEVKDGQIGKSYLVFGEGGLDQRHGELVPIVNGVADRQSPDRLRYEITTDEAGNVTGMDITSPAGNGGPYHVAFDQAGGPPIAALFAEALGSIVLHSDISIADATATPHVETPTQTPTEIPTPKPAWQTTIETQDPQDQFFKIVDSQPTIDRYDTSDVESVVLVKESITSVATTDGLNPNILTGQDAEGNKYAFNPDHGWFALPEVQMDYADLSKYTEVDQAFIEDGRANITTALLYAENPTISPDAIDPVYWVSYHWTDKVSGDRIPVLCDNACGLGVALINYPEEFNRTYYNETNKPFAWTGFYKVQLDNGESVYVAGRTLKNPSDTNPNQTINLFYGFDQATYERLAIEDAGPGRSPLVRFFEKTNNGSMDFVTILPPPEIIDNTPIPFQLSPNDWITGGNPVVGALQQRGELISEFDPANLQIMKETLHSVGIQGVYDYIAPLTQPLPAGFSTHILLSGFMNR